MIKVNVSIMGKRPGDVVTKDDKYYAVFKSWADRGDRRNGTVICEFCKPDDEEEAGKSEEGTGAASANEGEDAALDGSAAEGEPGADIEEGIKGGNKDIQYEGSPDRLKQARAARGQKR